MCTKYGLLSTLTDGYRPQKYAFCLENGMPYALLEVYAFALPTDAVDARKYALLLTYAF
jgi:hypothetical protein